MRHVKTAVALLLGSTLASLALGCGDDDPGPSPSGSGGMAGASGSGGKGGGGSGGSATSGSGGGGNGGGGSSGMTDAGDAGTFQPALLIDLGDTCNTPDGMRKDPKSTDIVLSCPNFFGKTPGDAGTFTAPPVLMKITADNHLEPYFANLPAPPDTPNRAGPMGIDFGPDGNLYVADHQYRYDTKYKSRVLRVNIDAMGKPTTADVVVDGIRLANAVMWNKDYLYLTDTWAFDEPAAGGKSAIYRFSKAELAAATTANPIHVQKPTSADGGADAATTDPHMFAQLTTEANRGVNLAGADGITFDDLGNLYTGNFGDGVITKITFDAQGNKDMQTIFVKDPKLTCADGIFFDAASKNIYVADSQKNAIKVISPTGTVSTLWENDDTTGVNGLLDQPAEPTLRGNDLIIANFDAGFPAPQPGKNQTSDAPHTISVIRLK